MIRRYPTQQTLGEPYLSGVSFQSAINFPRDTNVTYGSFDPDKPLICFVFDEEIDTKIKESGALFIPLNEPQGFFLASNPSGLIPITNMMRQAFSLELAQVLIEGSIEALGTFTKTQKQLSSKAHKRIDTTLRTVVQDALTQPTSAISYSWHQTLELIGRSDPSDALGDKEGRVFKIKSDDHLYNRYWQLSITNGFEWSDSIHTRVIVPEPGVGRFEFSPLSRRAWRIVIDWDSGLDRRDSKELSQRLKVERFLKRFMTGITAEQVLNALNGPFESRLTDEHILTSHLGRDNAIQRRVNAIIDSTLEPLGLGRERILDN